MRQWFCQMAHRLYPNRQSLQNIQIVILLQGFVLYLAVALETPADLSGDEMRWRTCHLRKQSPGWHLEIVLSPLAAHLKMKVVTSAASAGRQ